MLNRAGQLSFGGWALVRNRTAVAVTALALAWAAGPAHAANVRVAVAANFAAPLSQMAPAFTAATGHRILPSPGPTGRFYTQITVGGAPFEVLLAADAQTPRRLIAEGHAVAGSSFTYAIGQLVLWSAQPGLIDDQGAVLGSPRLGKLAIANPKVAPYGAAAMQVLHARGLAETLAPRLVTGDSIAQAYQFVLSGNADAGFVALSQVAVPGRPVTGSMWAVPASLYAPIRQDAVLLEAGARNPAAQALLDWLKTPAARAVISSYGYQLAP